MNKEKFTKQLIQFLDNSPTPYHAVWNIKDILDQHNYIQLDEGKSWEIKSNQGYYIIRGDSSIVAFHTGKVKNLEGYLLIGSHTDSPNLKLKPNPLLSKAGLYQLAVEIYGGVLLQSWLDRDLGIAGRIVGEDKKGNLISEIVDSKEALAFIPRLAIHLDREANLKGIKDNQVELNPVFSHEFDEKKDFNNYLLNYYKKNSSIKINKLIDFDLSFYPTEKTKLIGEHQEFLVGARLDNLLSCFVSIINLVNGKNLTPTMVVCHDHEEIGSHSYLGASGSFVEDVFTRLIPDQEARLKVKSNSIFLSLDNAHALHPNFLDKHEPNHAPILGKGPAIKINSSQKYATTSLTSAWFKQQCQKAKIKPQSFISHNAMSCGSTIGPLSSTKLGIKAIDVGIPTFGMHSIREMATTNDIYSLYKILKTMSL
jgi:aspartyl aminopeptidase